MNPYASALGTTSAACSTADHHQPGADRLHHAAGVEPILDTAAWSLMVTTVGAAWGIASAASSPTVKDSLTALREVAQEVKK